MDCTRIVLLVCGLFLAIETAFVSSETYRTIGPVQTCQREYLNITCDQHEVIMMTSARYGRMAIGRCAKQNLGYLGCVTDVLPYMDSTCSGRPTCTVYVANDYLYETHPCPTDITPYLEASYQCVPVLTDNAHQCRREHIIHLNSDSSGFLSSYQAEQHNYGTSACPWYIQAPAGQKINLTLYNFAAWHGSTSNLQPTDGRCYELATVEEKSTSSSNIITCGMDSRVRSVYVTKRNAVKVTFVDRTSLTALGAFLIKFQAIGCQELQIPKNSMITLDGDRATIKCNSSGETWYMTCSGTHWVGHMGNCSLGEQWKSGHWFQHRDETFPYGILLVVAIGVALGVFLGGILLSVVIFYIKRRQRMRGSHPVPTESPHDKDYTDVTWGTYGHHHHHHPHGGLGGTLPPVAFTTDSEGHTLESIDACRGDVAASYHHAQCPEVTGRVHIKPPDVYDCVTIRTNNTHMPPPPPQVLHTGGGAGGGQPGT